MAKNRAELILLHLRLCANWCDICAAQLAFIFSGNRRIDRRCAAKPADKRWGIGDARKHRARRAGSRGAERTAHAANTHGLGRPLIDSHTSGTSGKPKGVLLTERNIWQTALNFSLLGRVTHESAFLCDTPMFHVIGLITNIRPVMMRGGRFWCLMVFAQSHFGAPRGSGSRDYTLLLRAADGGTIAGRSRL